MVEEYSEEVVAAAAKIKLEENVRELIRNEIRSAVNDYEFMASIVTQLRTLIFAGAQWDYNFQKALKEFLSQQMSKS